MTWQIVVLIGMVFALAAFARACTAWENIRRYQSDNWREVQQDAFAANIGSGRQMDQIIARLTGQDPTPPPE